MGQPFFACRIAESEAECEVGAALFAAILTKMLESEADREGGAALFAAIWECIPFVCKCYKTAGFLERHIRILIIFNLKFRIIILFNKVFFSNIISNRQVKDI